MGMDVSGKAPTSIRGEYFRNNVWWWRPLWEYCQKVSPVAQKVMHGQYNGGDGLDAEDAAILASDLLRAIDSGDCAKYEDEYRARVAAMPDEECDLCNGTGKRTDITLPHGIGCNGCESTGKVRPSASWYPFDTENVREFAAFVAESGGFEIW